MSFEQFRAETAHNCRMSKSAALPATRMLELLVIALAVALAFLPVRAPWIEAWYSTTLYPHIERLLTPMSNRIAFAVLDPLLIVAFGSLLFALFAAARLAWRARSIRPAAAMLVHILGAAATVYVLFLALWGFNYRRVQMTERLSLEQPAPTQSEVDRLAAMAVDELNRVYPAAHQPGTLVPEWQDSALRAAFADVQRALSDAPEVVPGRLKHSLLGPYVRWAGVDGMVNPFGLEVIANPDLLPFERPFVAAHEWGHLAGYADESEANFVGWLTCIRAQPRHQYSAWFYLYWQVSGEIDADQRARLNSALAEGPRRDITAVIARLRAGEIPALQQASWQVYDKYLKANRVDAGVRSYSEVVTLLLRARFGPDWTPVRKNAPAPASSAR
jgi:hypothetical protein